MEAIEAYIWSKPEDLLSVTDTTQAIYPRCSKSNYRLTVFVWIFILPWQPFLVIMPCRHAGDKETQTLLKVPEYLAIIFGVANTLLYCLSSALSRSLNTAFQFQHLSSSNLKSYLHNETCTYIGSSGNHLHWTYQFPGHFMAPNPFTYSLLWLSVVFAKPKRFAAGIFVFELLQFLALLVYFDFSFEAGSVWCWSAMIMFLYFVFQPYLLPCKCEEEEPFIATNKMPANDMKRALFKRAQ